MVETTIPVDELLQDNYLCDCLAEKIAEKVVITKDFEDNIYIKKNLEKKILEEIEKAVNDVYVKQDIESWMRRKISDKIDLYIDNLMKGNKNV